MNQYLVVGTAPVFGTAPGGVVERELSEAESLLVGTHLRRLRPAPEPTTRNVYEPAQAGSFVKPSKGGRPKRPRVIPIKE